MTSAAFSDLMTDTAMKSCVAAVPILLLLPAVLKAQEKTPGDPVRVFALNAALGGITAGIARAAQDESPWGAIVRGSAGGIVVFAGKSIAARTRNGTIIGRPLAALGESEIRNASAGARLLDEFVIPYGPVRVYLTRDNWKPQPRLDLSTVGAATYFLMVKDGARFDPRRSFRYGAIVIAHSGLGDLQSAGVILLNPWNAEALPWKNARGHESVHLVQADFVSAVWNEPLETWILSSLPSGKSIHRNFDFGVLNILWTAMNHLIPYGNRPWEQEAYLLTKGIRPPF